VNTEEDGVDEAGRTTQTPLIATPPGREAGPDAEVTDAIADNDYMSPPSRSGSSRSGADATPAADKPAESLDKAGDNGRTVPLPADMVGTAGKAKTQDDKPAGQAGNGKPDAGSVFAPLKPSFTPSSQSSSGSGSSAVASVGYSGSPYSPPPAPHAYSAQPGNPRSDWASGGASGYPGSPGSPGQGAHNAAANGSATTLGPVNVGPAGTGAGTMNGNSANGSGTGSGFSAGAAAAVSGAAAGLAGYASSAKAAWQNRGNSRNKGATVRRPNKRQAMLTLARLEPWSVMKFSFVASVVAFIVLFVAVAVLYMVLSALGVFDSLQHTVSSVTSSKNSSGTNLSHYFSASLILGYTAMLGALNIVLITAISTVGSVIYNLIAKTVGGIEVTLRETE
jgi:hypothetical protein